MKPGFLELVRRRPGMFIGDTLEYGLHHLVYFLLDEAYRDARRGECGEVSVTLDADGGLSVFYSAPIVRPEALVWEVTQDPLHRDEKPFSHLAVVCALSSRFQVELWDGGRHWLLRSARGVLTGDVEEVLPAAAVPEGAARGTRLSFLPDNEIFEVLKFNPEWLERRCQELAMLVPGLRARVSSVAGGSRVMCYPGGVGQRLEELTANARRLHANPLVFDVHAQDLRVRCALQWCASEVQVLSFANTVRTWGHGAHVRGMVLALRHAVAANTGRPARRLRRNHLVRGLSAIIAVDAPDQQLHFQGPTKSVLSIPGLREAIARQLAPPLAEALRGHPALTHLIAFRHDRLGKAPRWP